MFEQILKRINTEYKKDIKKKKILRQFLSGLISDINDDRDFIFSSFKKNKVKNIPKKIDYTNEMSKVKYQGNIPACSAFAVVAIKEWQEQKEHQREVEEGKKDQRKQSEYNLSEAWVYWMGRKLMEKTGIGGLGLRIVMKVLHKVGVPVESAWPYNEIYGHPKKWAHLVARWSLIGSYYKIHNLEELKMALIKSPVMIGMWLFREIYGKLINGIIPYPKNPKNKYSKHAVCVVGYDDNKELIKFKNSWSRFFGYKGYGYVSYKYIDDFMLGGWTCEDLIVTNGMLKGTRDLIDDMDKI